MEIDGLNMGKYRLAENWFKGHAGVLIALSGGVDSCLVAYLARHFLNKNNVVAIIGDSSALKRRDYREAVDFCKQHDLKYQTVSPSEINDPRYNQNPEDRCFWCKNSLYTTMGELRSDKYPNFCMANGSNKSDWGDYRPGLKAADQHQVLSPLADCGFEKEDIRQMARYFGLKEWNKPASPCLSSRFPYGESITRHKLKLVEQAENLVNQYGFKDVRARYRSGDVSIEVPADEIPRLLENMPEIEKKLKLIGFKKASADEEGLVSGKLNRDIIGNNSSKKA